MVVIWKFRCLVWVMLSGFGTAYTVNYSWVSDASMAVKTATGIFAGLCGLSAVIALHISTLRCSETHTLTTLLMQYVTMQWIDHTASSLYSNMTKVWKHPRKEQEKFLKKLLARDAKTEYGRRHRFSDINSLQEFREKHPLTKYEHYRHYFTRLADGEKNVCVAADIRRFGASSGTTGKAKMIPMMMQKLFKGLYVASIPRLRFKLSPVQKMAWLYCKPAIKFTKSGLTIAPVFFIPDSAVTNIMLGVIQNTPASGFQIATDFEATYVHVLFALTDKNINQFVAPFASQVYRAFKMLENAQDMFLEDLVVGRINPKLNIDEGIRRSLDAALTPNSSRANELRGEFAKGFVGIAGRIWPHLAVVLSVEISGYSKKLEARYTKGTAIYSTVYGCTEGLIGVNVWLDKSQHQYALFPDDMIVEFIPEHLSFEDNPKTLLMDEVEVGKRYEIAMSTMSGFYRYRMGDVVEVVDFIECTPVLAVKYRTGELLNLRGEKINALVVNRAIQDCLEGWYGATLVEWTCAESPLLHDDNNDGEYMFYLLFIEFESEEDIRLSAEQVSLFDKSLRKQHEMYGHYREAGTICEARVQVVRPGSFSELKEYIIAHSTTSYNQFKTPKKLRTKANLDFMLGCVGK